MTRTLIIAAALLILCSQCLGAITVRLSADTDTAPRNGYAPATITIDRQNDTGKTKVSFIDIRNKRGGITVRRQLLVPIGRSVSASIFLPAVAINEKYAIALYAENDIATPQISVATAGISWPATMVNAEAFISPQAYERHDPQPARWPDSIKVRILLAWIAAAICMTAALLLLSRGKRTAAVIAISLASGVAMFLLIHPLPAVSVDRIDGELVSVSCKRATNWLPDRPLTRAIYYGEAEMLSTDILVEDELVRSVQLKPYRAVLFATRQSE